MDFWILEIHIHPKYYRHTQIAPISRIKQPVPESKLMKLTHYKWITGATMSETDRNYYNMIIETQTYSDDSDHTTLSQDSLSDHSGVVLTVLQEMVLDPILSSSSGS